MSRMKTFFKYLILFLLLYAFVSFCSYEFVKSTLVPVEDYNIEFGDPSINITEAKVSKVSGFIKGTITNNTVDTSTFKYIKVDLISKSDNTILSKYIDISNLEKGKIQDFEINFRAENIDKFKMTLVSDKAEESLNIKKSEIIGAIGGILLIWLIFAQ